MNKMTKDQTVALLKSYGESVVAAAAALLLVGVDPLDLLWSLVAAIAPVVIRAIDPNDPAFGRMPSAKVVEEALAEVKVKKAPAKKSAATTKKPAASSATKKTK
jgi:hypothetical protein